MKQSTKTELHCKVKMWGSAFLYQELPASVLTVPYIPTLTQITTTHVLVLCQRSNYLDESKQIAQ